MDLSIVIPALNENKKIARDIEIAGEFLQANNLQGEIIVIDDGSADDTAEAAKKTNQINWNKAVKLNVIRYRQHRGKGYAIRMGVKESSGKFVMFADSGGCVPYNDALYGLELLRKDSCDIAHGSRRMQGCRIGKTQSLYRRLCSIMFHWFVIHYMKIPGEFTDTQCGFKIYKGDVARRLFGRCVTDGFVFDIEVILRALKEGYRIREFPVNWTCDPDSRLSPTRSLNHVLFELIAIKRNLAKN